MWIINQNIVSVKFLTSIFWYSKIMEFRDRLREEIEFKGLQGKEIAAKVGLSYSTFLSYIDSRGVLPNVETAIKIAKVLGVSVEYLVDGKQSPGSSDPVEKMLISNFRNLSDSNKINLLKISEVIK